MTFRWNASICRRNNFLLQLFWNRWVLTSNALTVLTKLRRFSLTTNTRATVDAFPVRASQIRISIVILTDGEKRSFVIILSCATCVGIRRHLTTRNARTSGVLRVSKAWSTHQQETQLCRQPRLRRYRSSLEYCFYHFQAKPDLPACTILCHFHQIWS